MVMSLAEYEMQAKIVKETIIILESKMNKVRSHLRLNADCTMLKRELRELTLDMTITINELEQTENALEKFYSSNVL